MAVEDVGESLEAGGWEIGSLWLKRRRDGLCIRIWGRVALWWQYLGLADGFSLTAAEILLEMIEVHVRLH